MQAAIEELVKLGPFPNEQEAEVPELEKIEALLPKIETPVTDEEARALVGLFGPDGCYGLAWALLHAIETAPGWPLVDVLAESGNEWIDRLRRRARNSGLID